MVITFSSRIGKLCQATKDKRQKRFGLPIQNSNDPFQPSNNNRLIATELVSSVDEFMSRLFEELDYQKEVANMVTFADLYCAKRGTSKNVKVVVPEVLPDLCSDNVIVMQWITGTKLTNVVNENDDVQEDSTRAAALVAENLALVELCIECTLSQLLETGK